MEKLTVFGLIQKKLKVVLIKKKKWLWDLPKEIWQLSSKNGINKSTYRFNRKIYFRKKWSVLWVGWLYNIIIQRTTSVAVAHPYRKNNFIKKQAYIRLFELKTNLRQKISLKYRKHLYKRNFSIQFFFIYITKNHSNWRIVFT